MDTTTIIEFQNIDNAWDSILERLQTEYEISTISFETWIKPLKPLRLEGNVLSVLLLGEQLALLYVQKKYTYCLQEVVSEMLGLDIEVRFIGEEQCDS